MVAEVLRECNAYCKDAQRESCLDEVMRSGLLQIYGRRCVEDQG